MMYGQRNIKLLPLLFVLELYTSMTSYIVQIRTINFSGICNYYSLACFLWSENFENFFINP